MLNLKRRVQKLKHRPRTVQAVLLVSLFGAIGLVGLGVSRAATVDTVAPADPSEQILVKYKADSDTTALGVRIKKLDAVQTNDIKRARVKVLKVPKSRRAKTIQTLKADPAVQFAEPNYERHAENTTPNDPEYSKQWAWPKVAADVLWDKSKGSSSIVIADIDSGINFAHPEFAGKTVPGYDYANSDSDPTDDNGHGTWTAGTMAALTNNGVGVAGGCWECKIMPLKVLDSTASGLVDNTVSAINYAADHGAKVINMSLGGGTYSTIENDAIQNAISKGIVVVASAGNGSTDAPQYPANYAGVLAVAATDQNDALTTYSNFGPTVKIAAPGNVEVPAMTGNGYTTVDGTSFSAPIVSSIIAVLAGAFPNATVSNLTTAVTSTADVCCSTKISGGRVNAGKAYDYLVANPPSPGPTPTPAPTPAPPPAGALIGDLNHDGKVNVSDLSALLSAWGTADPSADINGSGKVDVADLSILLAHWS